MIYLVRVLLLPLWVAQSSLIFLIGDSVDRYILEDWCVFKGDPPGCKGSRCRYWASNTGIKTAPPLWAPSDLLCTMPNDTIVFGHHYGSAAQGPYLHNLTGKKDPLVNSNARIPRLLEIFFDRVGTPDLIIYHSALWDIQRIYEVQGTKGFTDHGELSVPQTALWNSSLLEFEINLNNRIDGIINKVDLIICGERKGEGKTAAAARSRNCSVDIALRTAVWFSVGGPLLHAINDVIRHVARERNLTLFDLDKDVWGTVDWDVSLEKSVLFRDWIHPKPYYTALAGEKLLGNRYTRYLEFRGQSAYHWPQVWLGDGPRPARVMEVKLIREQKPRSDVDKDNDENAENHYTITGRNPVAGDGKQSRASAGSGGSGSGSGNDDYKVRGSANEGLIFYLGDNKDSSAGADHPSNGINGKGERLAKEKDPLGSPPGRELIRLGPINKKLRSILKFSPGDVYSAPKAVCDSIPLRGSAPAALFDEIDRLNGTATKFAINSTAGIMYAVDGSTRRRVPSLKALEGIGLNASQIYTDVAHFWIEMLAPKEDPPVPDIFYDNTLVRYRKSKQIWAIIDKKRHAVASAKVFFKYHWDFSQVIVLDRESDIVSIPEGDTMHRSRRRQLH